MLDIQQLSGTRLKGQSNKHLDHGAVLLVLTVLLWCEYYLMLFWSEYYSIGKGKEWVMRECYKVSIWGENWDNSSSSSSSPEAVPISWIKAQMSPCCHQAIWVLPPSSCIIIVIPFDQMSVCWREGSGRIASVPIFPGNSRFFQHFANNQKMFAGANVALLIAFHDQHHD